MNRTIIWLGALLCLGLSTSGASANPLAWWKHADGCSDCDQGCDTCRGCHLFHLPGYIPAIKAKIHEHCQPKPPIIPTHPYARGPRDFFMLD